MDICYNYSFSYLFNKSPVNTLRSLANFLLNTESEIKTRNTLFFVFEFGSKNGQYFVNGFFFQVGTTNQILT